MTKATQTRKLKNFSIGDKLEFTNIGISKRKCHHFLSPNIV